MSSRFLIYALTCPRCGAVRYIGKSMSGMRRPRQHLAPSSLAQPCHRTHWLRSLIAANLHPGVRVLEELASSDGLVAAEVRWIAHGRVQGWPLTNGTDGGDGTPGHKHTEETLALLSKRARNKSPEVRQRMADAQRGKRLPPEVRAKISEAGKGRLVSSDTGAKISASLAGKAKPYMAGRNKALIWTPEMRDKIAQARRRETDNKPNVKPIRVGLVSRSISEWARAAGIDPPRFRARVRDLRWPMERALELRIGQ